jgi:hypothetical protein
VSIRLAGITDFNILSAFRDIEQKLAELEARQPSAPPQDPAILQLQDDVAMLKSVTERDSPNVFVPQGPMHLPGMVPDPDDTHVVTDRVLHANGEWASPLHGVLSLMPPGSGGTSLAQHTANLKGSLAVNGALSADSILCRRLHVSPQHCEVYIFDNVSTQTFTDANTFYQWTTNWAVSETGGAEWTASTSKILIKEPGVYLMDLVATVITGTANQDYEFAFFVNAATANDHRSHVSLLTTTEKRQVVAMAIATLAAGDLVDVRAQNVTSAGKALTIEDANFHVAMIR